MDIRPPLHLHLLAHPQSEQANALAAMLMHRFVEPPASGGLRVPVFFTPDDGDDLPPTLNAGDGLHLDAARYTIIVVLADARMLRTVPNGTGRAWIDFVEQAIAATPLDASPHHVLPVALEQAGFQISKGRHVLPAMLDKTSTGEQAASARRLAEVSFHIAARAIQLLTHGKVPADAPDKIKAPVTIFLSHAKADLDRQHREDPVRQTRSVLNELPVEQWFDAQQIATSQDFADAIQAGIRGSTIMLAFQTDQYSSRPWCRREVLEAKRLGAQILIVDALESGEPRSFPYSGNVPTVRWQFGEPDVDARRVIDRAVLEALRLQHNRAVLETVAEPGETVLAIAPEAVTLAYACQENEPGKTFLYPDPPLSREELQVLQQLRPKAQFITPLTKIAQHARQQQAGKINMITVSISDSEDVRKYGLSPEHFATLTDEIHLYLLMAGLKIAYGGALKGDFSAASNFTLRLFELVRAYSKLAENVQSQPLQHAIHNFAPWPLRLSYGDAEWNLFNSDIAQYDEGPRPDLPWDDDTLFPLAENYTRSLDSNSPQRRYAWAHGLSAMRDRITESSQARLVVGGRLTGFSGIVPGVVEEAWLSIKQQKPLYIAGGFGGAARAVYDHLLSNERVEFSDTWSKQTIPDYEAVSALNTEHGGTLPTMEKIGAALTEHAQAGIAQTLNNGLDAQENIALMTCTDPQRIAGFVLTGIGRLRSQ
ncbi:TIR domain-containing protein [Nitrosomonas aestuarii]|uniref:TIR domain-containing protein n=1 Tax=Nitrosomonas aestuarii TaxID=52441 RepID=UPI000D321CFE|nr:TIR domain-containing protein [Nitrosomonas aestuarii]PTN11890.1 TIR domain-containing protein [Nitrosomonas aestuarii]